MSMFAFAGMIAGRRKKSGYIMYLIPNATVLAIVAISTINYQVLTDVIQLSEYFAVSFELCSETQIVILVQNLEFI